MRNLCNLQRNNGVIKVPLELQELVLVSTGSTGTAGTATRRKGGSFHNSNFWMHNFLGGGRKRDCWGSMSKGLIRTKSKVFIPIGGDFPKIR